MSDESFFNDPAYRRLSSLLGEMQLVLGNPERWSEPRWERISRAASFRTELWDAITAYAREREGA